MRGCLRYNYNLGMERSMDNVLIIDEVVRKLVNRVIINGSL